MIEKIGLNCTSKNLCSKKPVVQNNNATSFGCLAKIKEALIDKQTSMAIKAQALQKPISIKAPGGEDGIRINNFIGAHDNMEISEKIAGTAKFVRTETGMEIKDKDDKTIFRAEFKNASDLPELTYKAGKFKPEITIHDESIGEKGRIQMFAGSQVKGDGFTLTMPGEYKNYKENKDISFTGHTVVTTLNKEQKTKAAVDKYYQSKLASKTTKGEYADFMKEQDPTIAIPAGGFGTRFMNVTEEDGENKPSAKLPTSDDYRIMATSLNMAASAGIIGGENDKLDYISQSTDDESLKENGNVHKVKQYKTDGGAIYAAMKDGIINEDKDLIVLNADIITNADITRAYKALKDLPDAALVIPYYPVNSERAKSFGLIGLEKDEKGNMQMKKFIEKPTYTDIEPTEENFKPKKKDETLKSAHQDWHDANTLAKKEDGTYYGNPGIYVMSKEGASVLKELGDLDETETGLGADVMKKIVEKCNNGELTKEDGTPLKAYTIPLERKDGEPAFWDDIGSAEAYLKTIKDIADETTKKEGKPVEENKFYGMPSFVLNDFKKNVDLDTSIVYMSDKAREIKDNFSEKYGATLTGNILVAD